MNHLKPIVGQWYMRHDKGQIFSVVGIDDASGTVETQDFDGSLDEVEIKSWFMLSIEPIATPEDWTAPLDKMESDDVGATDAVTSEAAQEEQLQPVRGGGQEAWQDVTPEDESDEWDEGTSAGKFIADEPDAARRSTH
jgi:hypothetical protein